MITLLLLNALVSLLSAIFIFLPVVTLANIPYIGDTVRNMLIQAVTTWNAFMVTFPYATVVWQSVQIIIAFELTMIIGKFFLGNRMPEHKTN